MPIDVDDRDGTRARRDKSIDANAKQSRTAMPGCTARSEADGPDLSRRATAWMSDKHNSRIFSDWGRKESI